MLVQIPSVENLCNERELEYSDGRDKRTAGPRMMCIQRTLRSMMVEVPDPKNANEKISVPAFDTVLPNVTGASQGTATATIVASRKEAVELYKKMSVCFYAWLYCYWIKVSGYTEAVAKSLVSGFGDHAYGCSQNAVFDVEKLEVKVEYRDNKAQVELEAIEQELGIVDNTGVEETHGTKIVLEMVDARKQMERMRSRAQMGASMTSPGAVSYTHLTLPTKA